MYIKIDAQARDGGEGRQPEPSPLRESYVRARPLAAHRHPSGVVLRIRRHPPAVCSCVSSSSPHPSIHPSVRPSVRQRGRAGAHVAGTGGAACGVRRAESSASGERFGAAAPACGGPMHAHVWKCGRRALANPALRGWTDGHRVSLALADRGQDGGENWRLVRSTYVRSTI